MWEEIKTLIYLSLLIITSETLRPVNQHPNVPKGDTDGLTGHDAIDVWELLLVIEESQVVSIWAFLACYTLLWKDMKWQFKQTYQVLGGSKCPLPLNHDHSWSFMLIKCSYIWPAFPQEAWDQINWNRSVSTITQKKTNEIQAPESQPTKIWQKPLLTTNHMKPNVVFPYIKHRACWLLSSTSLRFKFQGSSCDSSIVTNCVGLYPPEWRNPPIPPEIPGKTSRKTGRPEIEIEEKKKGV